MAQYKETKALDDKFNSAAIEERAVRFWEDSGIYAYDKTASRDQTFVVDTPPPTVSGSLHIGHIFSYTQTDVMVRYNRMKGKSIFYPIGWDDNGLPTERRVQNYYNIACNPALPYDPDFKPVHDPKADGGRKEVSRQNFIEACEELTRVDEQAFEDIFHKIGHSYDWRLKYTTIGSKAIVESQKSFLDLIEKGMARSVEAPTMWDVTFQSAIAQAEIEDRETAGFFHDIRFRVEGSDTTFTIATTRPEFLPACIAVVAHPDDERYKPFFGKKAIVPLFDIPVPIVPSEHAEMDKGTGIMMVCTFGDAADVAWWKQSGLPIKQIIGLDGRIIDQEYGKGNFVSLNAEKAKAYYDQIIGLKVKDARAKIVSFLSETGDLLAEPKPLMHPVKFYEKGNIPLEFVSSRQWFINILNYKKELLELGRKIKWTPAHMQSRYEAWVDGLNQDWCISRQRFFGVPFPVWYKVKENGEINYNEPIFADRSQLPVDPMTDVPAGYKPEQRGIPGGFVGDKDVMDTWATSSVTPQIAMAHAPEGHHLSMPFDIRPQAHDIIRTWAFYTIMKSFAHTGKEPWHEALISGFILDPDRKKMSKSKGNVVTPIDLLIKHSADAVRYWAARAKLGIDTAFEEQIMEQGRKLTMKIFNASKFVFMILDKSGVSFTDDYHRHITAPVDKAWAARLSGVVETANKSFEANDYAFALEMTEKCFWDFCDNYLELVKGRAYSDHPESAVATLMLTIDILMRLFAPFLSFTTEEVWQSRPWAKDEKSIHISSFPQVQELNEITGNSAIYEKTAAVLNLIRKEKAEQKRSLKTPVIELTIRGDEQTLSLAKNAEEDIMNAGNVKVSPVWETSDNLSLSICVFGEDEKKQK